MLTTTVGLQAVLGAQLKGSAEAFKDGQVAVWLGSPHASGVELWWEPKPVLDALAANHNPDVIELDEMPLRSTPPRDSFPRGVTLTGLRQMTALTVGASFVRYYESAVDLIRASYGGNPQDWPPVWNFARVVRNAVAHGGVLEIRNPSASPVQWRGTSYGPADDGKKLLYQDFTLVEAVLLMADMDIEV